MIRQAVRHAAVGSPVAALLMHGIPWWGIVIAAAPGPLAYICRLGLQYRLTSKALDKIPPSQAAAVITAINGQPAPSLPDSSRTPLRPAVRAQCNPDDPEPRADQREAGDSAPFRCF
jgi:hypothetical protein